MNLDPDLIPLKSAHIDLESSMNRVHQTDPRGSIG